MTAFDAHLQQDDDSAWRRAATIIGARPGVTIVSILITAMIVCLAFLALVAGQESRYRAARTVDGLEASVFLRPQATRAVAEALKEQLTAIPYVRDPVLRTKEAAIVALETSGLPPVTGRANPLPDVWVVTLAFGEADPTKTLSIRVSEARQALARLPDVETVDVDAAWVATLDRWQQGSATAVRLGLAIGFPVVWLVLASVFYLTGRAFASGGQVTEGRPRGAAALIIGIVVGVLALLVASALGAAVAYFVHSAGLELKPIVGRIGQMGECIAVLATSTIVLAAVTIGTSGRR